MGRWGDEWVGHEDQAKFTKETTTCKVTTTKVDVDVDYSHNCLPVLDRPRWRDGGGHAEGGGGGGGGVRRGKNEKIIHFCRFFNFFFIHQLYM